MVVVISRGITRLFDKLGVLLWLEAVDELSPDEQAAFQRAIVKMIRAMQLKGDIPVSRMCVSCTWFRPNAHPGGDQGGPEMCR